MNYIKKLQLENTQLKNNIETAINELIEYQRYYNSSKFTSVENDFAHVSTDVYVKITTIKMYLQNTLNAL
jgi:hypothetical protein